MLIIYGLYLSIYKKFIYISLGFFTVNLIKLNNIRLNYLILLLTVIFINYLLKKTINYAILLMLIFFIKKIYYFFIKRFYFGFFKIHPIIFYIIITFYFININKFLIFLKINYLTIAWMSIVSFTLGGYWNIFHLHSGLFWSNDSIEIILLILVLIYLKIIHKFFIKQIYNKYQFFIVICIIIFIRFNFIYTKHNFFNLNKKKLLIIIFIFTLFTINTLINTNKLTIKHIITNKVFSFAFFLKLIFVICLNYLNYFLIRKINKFFINYLYIIIICSISWINFTKLSLHLIIFALIFIYNLFYIKYVYLLNNYSSIEKILFYFQLNNIITKNFYNNKLVTQRNLYFLNLSKYFKTSLLKKYKILVN